MGGDGNSSRDAILMDNPSDRQLTRMVIVGEEDESGVQSVELVRREAKPWGTWERCVGCLLVFLLVCCGGLTAIWFWANNGTAAVPDQDRLKPKQELTAPSMPAGESCTNSTPAQVQAWPPKKKQWCCERQSRGCPSTVTKTSTSASTIGCEAQCTFNATSASCKSRVLFAAHFLFAARDKPCDAAYAWVLSQCPSCSGCPRVSSGCKNVQSTTSAAVVTAKDACDTLCAGNSGSVSCKERVIAIANSTFAGDPDTCVLAFASVLKICQVCAACPLADVGCSAAAPAGKASHQ